MSSISRDDVFKVVISVLLSLLSYIGLGIHNQQADISQRLRIVELNQARIMERMGVDSVGFNSDGLQGPLKSGVR